LLKSKLKWELGDSPTGREFDDICDSSVAITLSGIEKIFQIQGFMNKLEPITERDKNGS